MSTVLQVAGARKSFGGVRALVGVDLELAGGEIVGLLGHNGAGKSTLVRALSGADPLDSGEIRLDHSVVRISQPRDARELGIETLYQDLALADALDAVANLYLGRELRTFWRGLDEDAMERDAREILGRVNPELRELRRPVRELSGGQRQAVAFARALCFDARVLILDEPTAALGPEETAVVVAAIRRLREEGLAILIVSHDLHGVFELADRLVVMRRGAIVGEARPEDTDPDTIVSWMISGRTAA